MLIDILLLGAILAVILLAFLFKPLFTGLGEKIRAFILKEETAAKSFYNKVDEEGHELYDHFVHPSQSTQASAASVESATVAQTETTQQPKTNSNEERPFSHLIRP